MSDETQDIIERAKATMRRVPDDYDSPILQRIAPDLARDLGTVLDVVEDQEQSEFILRGAVTILEARAQQAERARDDARALCEIAFMEGASFGLDAGKIAMVGGEMPDLTSGWKRSRAEAALRPAKETQ